jgi:hypothetical protein
LPSGTVASAIHLFGFSCFASVIRSAKPVFIIFVIYYLYQNVNHKTKQNKTK